MWILWSKHTSNRVMLTESKNSHFRFLTITIVSVPVVHMLAFILTKLSVSTRYSSKCVLWLGTSTTFLITEYFSVWTPKRMEFQLQQILSIFSWIDVALKDFKAWEMSRVFWQMSLSCCPGFLVLTRLISWTLSHVY